MNFEDILQEGGRMGVIVEQEVMGMGSDYRMGRVGKWIVNNKNESHSQGDTKVQLPGTVKKKTQ